MTIVFIMQHVYSRIYHVFEIFLSIVSFSFMLYVLVLGLEPVIRFTHIYIYIYIYKEEPRPDDQMINIQVVAHIYTLFNLMKNKNNLMQ